MLYHASKIRGMRTIEPHISTHGKAYVYAIRNQVTAVCFGAPKDDFDLLMDNQDGKTVYGTNSSDSREYTLEVRVRCILLKRMGSYKVKLVGMKN